MTNFNDYIDEYAAKNGIKNDSKLGEFLGTSRSYIHQIRKKGNATDELCVTIAEAIGVHPGLVMIQRDILKGGEQKSQILADFLANVRIIAPGAKLVLEGGREHKTGYKDYRKFWNLSYFNNLRQFLNF